MNSTFLRLGKTIKSPSLLIQRQKQSSLRLFSSLKSSYENILASTRDSEDGKALSVGLIELNKPKSLNSLSDDLFDDLIHASRAFDAMDDVGSIVITGKGKAFAAGADIPEMSKKEFYEAYNANMFSQWADITKISKPIIAAVNGFALGGGCELAMMCDIIIASPNAKFGQPEVNLGIIPGAGGTQRLVRTVGKSKAMEMVLTGCMIDAERAERDGLVSKVVDREMLLDEAIQMGHLIGEKGPIAIRMAKECINAADQMSLDQGLQFERRLFHSLFASKDQKEGMDAFLNKRAPDFTNS
mmetsp:Transcript_368/g.472  ORF Transcript_368/g.472 Transcript_368/m.472 type:complete len:299 (+) Transcript_368:87-983(+)|eukprot:CAMPEP_0197245522 /NCGR_PEP_ID=MMETSP1429-20130617/10285_1 /TAXON_ID=49237 /ORGANISM="Chaetoceros  sp., Strain UNC1202" /LENGTH=298 /DNA_ID=CAMNT_0042706043 /DNA_START=43 /DNA_END=939 /DNA_ORIENTATION=-